MTDQMYRRDFLKLAGVGGAVFVSSALRAGAAPQQNTGSFYFVQISDTHWGFNGPAINPDSQGTLNRAIAAGIPSRSSRTSSCSREISLRLPTIQPSDARE